MNTNNKKRVSFFVVVMSVWGGFLFLRFVPSAHAAVEISDGSVRALYHLENLNDASGNGNVLINNGPTAFSGGKFGNAADGGADNVADYLYTPNSLGIDGGPISISAWVKIDAQPRDTTIGQQNISQTGMATYTFVEQRTKTGNHVGYGIHYVDYNGTTQLQWVRERIGDPNGANLPSGDGVAENITLTPGVWYHLVLTYDGTSVEGWINGVRQGSHLSSGSGDPNQSICSGFAILNYTCGINNFTSGLVDEVLVTNDALSSSTIAALYNNGAGQEVCVTAGCGPVQAINDLISAVESMNLAQGIQNSLDTKLQNASDALSAANAANRADAINKLQAFINAVQAQSGNKLTVAQANQLINEANQIIASL